MSTPSCHRCGSEQLTEIDTYRKLMRVASDCKPWATGGRLAVCGECGASQAIIDDVWRTQAKDIYQNYDIWAQANGAEQAVFDPVSNQAITRSERLLIRLKAALPLPLRGRWLDIGCGRGALLEQISRFLPGWGLVGTEFNQKHRDRVEGIPGVEGFYNGPLSEVPGKFDVISLVHVLEHLEQQHDPRTALEWIQEKLAPGGLVFIEVPDFTRNPFELIIADHATHFSEETLCDVMTRAGFEIVISTKDWVAKELSLVARMTDSGTAAAQRATPAEVLQCTIAAVEWLNAFKNLALQLSQTAPIGVFGSSIGASFIAGTIPNRVPFFLDEDPSRLRQHHLGIPILHPREAPAGSRLLLPIAPIVAEKIAQRLRDEYGMECHYIRP